MDQYPATTVTLTLTQEQVALILSLARNEASHEADCYWPENIARCRSAAELARVIMAQTAAES